MTIEWLCRLLGWSLALNYAVLMLWFLVFVFARRGLQRLHGRWFRLADDTFDAIHYGGMAVYKIGILLFNLVPLLALCLLRGSG